MSTFLSFAGRRVARDCPRPGRQHADVLVLCGDLTDYGTDGRGARARSRSWRVRASAGRRRARQPRLRIAASSEEVRDILATPACTCSTATRIEVHGVGFAGVKGFAGGFGRGALGPWGEPAIKEFVQEAVDEALKLETALARLATRATVAVLHYSPIRATVEGEPQEIYPVPRLRAGSRSR